MTRRLDSLRLGGCSLVVVVVAQGEKGGRMLKEVQFYLETERPAETGFGKLQIVQSGKA